MTPKLKFHIASLIIGISLATCGSRANQKETPQKDSITTDSLPEDIVVVYDLPAPIDSVTERPERTALICSSPTSEEMMAAIAAKVDTARIYEIAEEMPSFPGGIPALMNYIRSNLVDPYMDAQCEHGSQARVVCRFVVNRDGSISDIVVVRSVAPSADKEAVRVVKSMPKWIQGKQNGIIVKVQYTIPIVFPLR
jgi:TonB family protein